MDVTDIKVELATCLTVCLNTKQGYNVSLSMARWS